MARDKIDISGIDKAELLAALYNASKPLGLGFFHASSESMTKDAAQKAIDSQGTYFDYLNGRVMTVDIGGDELNTRMYDRDNGNGAAARVVSQVIAGKKVVSKEIKATNELERAALEGQIEKALKLADNEITITNLPSSRVQSETVENDGVVVESSKVQEKS